MPCARSSFGQNKFKLLVAAQGHVAWLFLVAWPCCGRAVTMCRAAPQDALVVDKSHPELCQVVAEASGELFARVGRAYRWWDGDLIGRGAYGKVYVATQRHTGMMCALTIIATEDNVEWAR